MSNDSTLLGALAPAAPLAARMRPATIDEVVGQEALIGPGAPLRRLLERGETPSLLLWGPPGSGKSTLAAVIAAAVRAVPTSLSATSDGVAEVRKAVAAAAERRAHGEQTLLFIDELHRFSRTQQDALLPHVDAFLPVHTIDSLESLASVLAGSGTRPRQQKRDTTWN
jgi:putative ATPase